MTAVTTRPAPGPLTTTHELSLVVRRIAADPRRWRSAVRFGAQERYWTRLDGPEGVDVWLLTWLPSQAPDLHDVLLCALPRRHQRNHGPNADDDAEHGQPGA